MSDKRPNVASICVLGLINILGLVGMVVFVANLSAFRVAALGAFVFWTVLGISVGYHRLMTHQSFKSHPAVKFVLLMLGGMAVQGEVVGWAENHQRHHQFQDKKGKDPHTPNEYPGIRGFLWAHIGWMLAKPLGNDQTAEFNRLQRDLMNDRIAQFQRRIYWYLIVVSFGVPTALMGWHGWQSRGFEGLVEDGLVGLLVYGFFRVFFTLHLSWCVNSVCHTWGTRARDSRGNRYLRDRSRNNWLIAVMSCGEGLHSNHHAQPHSAFFGWRWYEFDPGKWLIKLLSYARLVYDVHLPRKDIVFAPPRVAAAA